MAKDKLDVLVQQPLLVPKVQIKAQAPSQSKLKNLQERYQNGQYDDAEKLAKAIIQKFPKHLFSWKILGAVLRHKGKISEALTANQKAVDISPQNAEAHSNLGATLAELGRLQEAQASYKKAIALKPDFVNAHYNLGNMHQELGKLEEAEASYNKAVALKPDFAVAHSNLGTTLRELGRLKDAETSYRNAVALKPDFAEAHSNLGIALKELGRLENAQASYEKAIALKPDFAEAHYNLGRTLKRLNRMDDALARYERANALKPDIEYLLGALLHAKMHLCNWDDLPSQLHALTEKINNGEKVSTPFPLHALIDDPGIHRKSAEIYASKNLSKQDILPKISPYHSHERIRVGYFSPDFRNHPVSYLTAQLYEIHDRQKFEIYAFSFGADTKDEFNSRIKAGVDHFHDVRMMSDKDVALLARSVELDIAIDLVGYTGGCRPGIFAMSAAPIQIGYIGYLGTMGTNYYDYLISDRTIIPEQNRKYYSESIVYLPSYQANDSQTYSQDSIRTRQDFGLPDEGFIFCCFNNNYKITPDIFDCWARILKQVDSSVLLLYVNSETAKRNLEKEISIRGIDSSRLIFGGTLPTAEYLARYGVVDLFLDTLPYNGGTVVSDALRTGLPVLTCMGNSFASSMAASLLNAVNLPELITTTHEQYELLAIELATNSKKFNSLKEKLISNLSTAPLYDSPLFTKHLETAYLTMFDKHQNGLDLDDIYVQ